MDRCRGHGESGCLPIHTMFSLFTYWIIHGDSVRWKLELFARRRHISRWSLHVMSWGDDSILGIFVSVQLSPLESMVYCPDRWEGWGHLSVEGGCVRGNEFPLDIIIVMMVFTGRCVGQMKMTFIFEIFFIFFEYFLARPPIILFLRWP